MRKFCIEPRYHKTEEFFLFLLFDSILSLKEKLFTCPNKPLDEDSK